MNYVDNFRADINFLIISDGDEGGIKELKYKYINIETSIIPLKQWDVSERSENVEFHLKNWSFVDSQRDPGGLLGRSKKFLKL